MITSRIAGYAGPPLPGAMEVELQPFTPGDVTQVIRAWQLPAAAERELMGRATIRLSRRWPESRCCSSCCAP